MAQATLPLPAALLLAGAVGFAGGAAGSLLLGGPAAPSAGPGSPVSPGETSAGASAQEIDARQDAQIQQLQASLTAVQGELIARSRAEMAAPVAESGRDAAAEPGASARLAALRPGAELDRLLDSRVEAILDQRAEQERKEREARQAEIREQFLAARVERLSRELGLNAFQTSELDRILRDSERKRDEYFAGMRDEGSWNRDQVREQMRVLREETETQLSGVLTPEQMARYRELSPTGFRGDGFRGDGSRGDGFGGVPGGRRGG